MLQRLLHDHVMMRRKAAELLQLLDRPDAPDSDVLAKTRWVLSSHIMQHLALEDRHLYAKLLIDDRPHVREIGHRFQSDLTVLFAEFSDHAQHWTPTRIAGNWTSFRVASRRLVMKMMARIDYEEAELFPLARAAAIDLNTATAPTTNWTRKAFAIKDAVVDGVSAAQVC